MHDRRAARIGKVTTGRSRTGASQMSSNPSLPFEIAGDVLFETTQNLACS
jgi:hypothetical protein